MLRIIAILLLCTACATSSSKSDKNEQFEKITINNNKIFVPVFIQGKQYNFVVDTGAKGTSLSAKLKLSEILKLKVVAKAKYAGANRVYKTTNIYRLPELSVCGRLIKDINVTEYNMVIDDADGLLGMDVFKKYSLFIDLISNQMTLLDEPKRLKHQMSFDFVNKEDVLLKARINGKEYGNFLFDTGAGTTDCTHEIVNEANLKEQKDRAITIRDATGNEEKTFYVAADEFCLGEICKKSFDLMPAKYHSLEKRYKRNGILGFDIMSGHRFSLDISGSTLFYE